MKTVAILSNPRKDKNFTYAKQVVEYLSDSFNLISSIKTGVPGTIGVNEDLLYKEADYFIVLGGDGTILNVARSACKFNKPVLGINAGNLGFLAEVERDDLEKHLKKFKEGKYTLEKRSMISAKIVRNGRVIGEKTALNDVVISRATFRRMIDLKVYIDKTLADMFCADGVILCTPTGSTAYSLSAGGPIIDPVLDVTAITPICPHSLSSRSIIVPSNKNVEIVLGGKTSKGLIMTIDGQEGFDLLNRDKICVTKSKYTSTFIKLGDKNFYGVLEKKMGKRGRNFD